MMRRQAFRLHRAALVSLLLCTSLGLVCLLLSFSDGEPVLKQASLQEEDDNDERQLFSLVTRQCSLSTNLAYFRFNATSGLYTQQHNDEEPPPVTNTSAASDKSGRFLTSTDPGFSQKDGAVVEMRACWCTEVFFNRPLEFCPSYFDTCLVQGSDGPVSCFHTTGADSFVRSFWPVLIFWLAGLLYALMCSEPGGSARDFVRRKLCVCCADGENQVLERDLQRMLDHQPERAAFLYRHAILRARHLGFQNRPARAACFGCCRRRSASDSPGRDEDAYNLYMNARYDRLLLKTRIFGDNEEDEEDNDDDEEQVGTPRLNPMVRESSTSSLGSPTRVRGQGTAWLPPQFRREQVTLNEMDEQMEQGVRCSICLSRLEHGDVVGDIPCGHVFHKDCLKDWLKRKNRCPLCQQPDVARRKTRSTMEEVDRL